MKEISLNILDIAQNSVKAGASLIEIDITEDADTLQFSVKDNGCGMSAAFLEQVTSPFATTRTTRKVGLGIPLLKMSAELTGGSVQITSKSKEEYPDHGTCLTAVFKKNNIDCVPLGDIVSTVLILIHGIGQAELAFTHQMPGGEVALSTAQLRQILGDSISLSAPEIMGWIQEYLRGSYDAILN